MSALRMFFVFPNVFNGGYDMKKMILSIFVLVFVFALTATASEGEKYKSLRGDSDIPGGSNPTVGMDWKPGDAAVPRTFVHQPPLIPHAVSEYEIDTEENDCLECHGEKDSGAPMPHASHFSDRDGKATEEVSPLWYFCTQCHVGQVDAKPLIENTFEAK